MKKLGFGCMRLPLLENGEVDIPQFCRMTDLFLQRGFTYFDTAHGYLDGKSETALRAALTSRHPRSTYTLADKLTAPYFESEADIRPFFASQLEACGVDYFDYYLMHALGAGNYEKFTSCRAFETAQALKAEGKIRHVGFSFHDKAEVLDRILTDHPEVEFVQIQFNYADYDDPGIESFRCYEVCCRHNKPVVVMEPVKGGSLAGKLPPAARLILDNLQGGSPAGYALRFAAGFERNFMVLSGMSDLAQMEENTALMQAPRPLTDAEQEALAQVRAVLRSQDSIACTACRYCTAGCPMQIDIPALFACYNAKRANPGWDGAAGYAAATAAGGRAGDCIGCGQCEGVCPQHLEIRALLGRVSGLFEG